MQGGRLTYLEFGEESQGNLGGLLQKVANVDKGCQCPVYNVEEQSPHKKHRVEYIEKNRTNHCDPVHLHDDCCEVEALPLLSVTQSCCLSSLTRLAKGYASLVLPCFEVTRPRKLHATDLISYVQVNMSNICMVE